MQSLKEQYLKTAIPALREAFGLKNQHQVPRVLKVVVNAGVGRHIKEAEYADKVSAMLARITGQKPSPRAARKSIAGFKMRAGQIVGLSVTLRGNRMYDFLERLTRLVFPRMRDFRGITDKGFDGRGNFALGMTEVAAFPEAKPEDIELGQGIQIIVATDAKNNEKGKALLTAIGFPFITGKSPLK